MIEDLSRRLNAICDEQPFKTSWYLKNLKTGDIADRDGDVVLYSASTRKVSILAAAMRAVHRGELSLDDPFTIQAKYQNNKSGCFQHLTPGFTITFRDALVMMIIVSDNTCTAGVVDTLGLDRLNEFCQSVGMVNSTHRENQPSKNLAWDFDINTTNTTTPHDVGMLLELILQGTTDPAVADKLGSSTELCQLALDILSWQRMNERLPFLMPPDAKIAHKTGTGPRGYHDSGIIFQGNDPLYVLTVFTDQLQPVLPDGSAGRGAAYLTIARLCREAWDALSTQ